MEKLPKWTYNNKPFTEPTEEQYGFIYKITYDDDTWYIGKKSFWSYKRLPKLKNGNKREGHIGFTYTVGSGKRKYLEIVRKESNWKQYTGSNDCDKPIKKREILAFARTNRELTYLETKYQFIHSVLEDDMCINENILGKFFRGNIV